MALRLADDEPASRDNILDVPASATRVTNDTYLFDLTVSRPDLRADIHCYAVARRVLGQMWRLWDGEYRGEGDQIEPDVEASWKLTYGCFRTLAACETRLLERMNARSWADDALWVEAPRQDAEPLRGSQGRAA